MNNTSKACQDQNKYQKLNNTLYKPPKTIRATPKVTKAAKI